MEENRVKFVKAKLNYMSAVSKTEPVARIPVNASKMVELDLSIKEKHRQNILNNKTLEGDDLYHSPNQDEIKLLNYKR